ncbi:MAG: GDSL-type esterase/lipase family protein, partial [Deltaproteobacteria bacterium]|nr:GDSL-type esterase/lipase family protein [Deltaproteobacteria bacterium]
MLRPYPAVLQKLFDQNFGSGRIQVMNFGIIGYSSFHGLRVLRREVLAYDPDYVIIRFGWNDLLASPTGKSFASVHNPWLERLEDLAYRSRLFALLMYRGVPLGQTGMRTEGDGGGPVPWVTEVEYAWNLSRMIDLARAHGAIPILLDAPAAPITPEMRANKLFIASTGFESFEQYLAAHDRYQVITERVAAEKDVQFLRTAPSPEEAPKYFTAFDIPHPNQAGQDRIAYRLNAELTPTLVRKMRR